MIEKEKKYQPLISPNVFWKKGDDKDLKNFSEVNVHPLETGFGQTFGNSMRRMLLGGIEGSAVTSIIIEGVNNECSVVYGCVEDTMSIILNIKQLVIKNETGEPGELILEKEGEGVVTAADIKCDSHLSIINKDLVIANLAKDGKLKIKFFVTSGRGYLPAVWPKGESLQEDSRIYIDATFSPIKNVYLDVKKTRVGDNIDYDQMVLGITTNGTLTPKEAYEYAVSVLLEQFGAFLNENKAINFPVLEDEKASSSATENILKEFLVSDKGSEGFKKEGSVNKIDEALAELLFKSIDVLGLPARAHNCLLSSGVQRVIDLVNMTERDITTIKNFGNKSRDDLYQTMKDFGLSFDMKIDEESLMKSMENK